MALHNGVVCNSRQKGRWKGVQVREKTSAKGMDATAVGEKARLLYLSQETKGKLLTF